MAEVQGPQGSSNPFHSSIHSSHSQPGTFQASGSGDGWSSFKSFLGPEGYKKFMKMLCQSITQEIGKQQKKMHEASEKLKRAETGQDD